MTIIHTIQNLKTDSYKNARRRHEILTNSTVIVRKKEKEKISFSFSIVRYNQHMRRSDKNAQQRSYYSFKRFD